MLGCATVITDAIVPKHRDWQAQSHHPLVKIYQPQMRDNGRADKSSQQRFIRSGPGTLVKVAWGVTGSCLRGVRGRHNKINKSYAKIFYHKKKISLTHCNTGSGLLARASMTCGVLCASPEPLRRYLASLQAECPVSWKPSCRFTCPNIASQHLWHTSHYLFVVHKVCLRENFTFFMEQR